MLDCLLPSKGICETSYIPDQAITYIASYTESYISAVQSSFWCCTVEFQRTAKLLIGYLLAIAIGK